MWFVNQNRSSLKVLYKSMHIRFIKKNKFCISIPKIFWYLNKYCKIQKVLKHFWSLKCLVRDTEPIPTLNLPNYGIYSKFPTQPAYISFMKTSGVSCSQFQKFLPVTVFSSKWKVTKVWLFWTATDITRYFLKRTLQGRDHSVVERLPSMCKA